MYNPDHYAPFEFERYYHVFNRSNNREPMFTCDDNYHCFLRLLDKYLSGYINMYPYCLLPNHFHLMIQVKQAEEMTGDDINHDVVNKIITEQFRKFFIAYTTYFNKNHDRNGNLFHRRFKRILINSDAYFSQLTYYIHLNPVKHHITEDYENYRWSSYKKVISPGFPKLKKNEILDWFGGAERYVEYHKKQASLYEAGKMFLED